MKDAVPDLGERTQPAPSKLAALRDGCDQLLAIFTTISKTAKSKPS